MLISILAIRIRIIIRIICFFNLALKANSLICINYYLIAMERVYKRPENYFKLWALKNKDKIARKQLNFLKNNYDKIMNEYKSPKSRPEYGWIPLSEAEKSDLVLDIVRRRTGKKFSSYDKYLSWLENIKQAALVN